MTEENIKQEQINPQVKSRDALLNALDQQFATSVTRIYVNSLQKEVDFREISVQEQKTLTRIMAANEKRKDVIYDAQCALIQDACLDKTFDIYSVSEFDRLKLLMSIYQTNMFTNEVKFTCSECGQENIYKIDFDNVLAKLDQFDLTEKSFVYENKHGKFEFIVKFPLVKKVSDFNKSYYQMHKVQPKKMNAADENMQNIEYVNIFIKEFTFTPANGAAPIFANLDEFKVGDTELFLSRLPQDVIYSENGVLKYIVDNFIKKLNDAFDKHECGFCGAVHEKGDTNNVESFL